MASKVIEVFWFSSSIPVGIVVCEDEITKEKFGYIGAGNGKNLDRDIQHIKDYGCKVNAKKLREIIGILEG